MSGAMEPQTWVSLAATAAAWTLLGLSWTVQRAVYPAFPLVGPTSWPAYHAAHTRALAGAVGPPWLVQGVAALALPLVPGPVPWWLAASHALAVAVPVVLTVAVAVPLHTRLGRSAPAAPGPVRRLRRVHAARTVGWAACAVLASGALLVAAGAVG